MGIRAQGFRNLSGYVPLHAGVAIVVGENNAGKSNLVDACRILFEPEVGPAGRLWITESDFAHDGSGKRIAETFELEAVLGHLDTAEQGRMVTCLAPSLGPGKARLRLRATLSDGGKVRTEWFGGDSSHPDVEAWAREAVTFTYLHPLRDAASDLRPGRSNRLAALISALAPEGHSDRGKVEAIILAANNDLRKVDSVANARERVQDRLSKLTGSGRLHQLTDLVFAEPKFDRVIATLRALMGSLGPVEITESGLGYSNLLYMSVLLSALEEDTDAALRLLLIEEPEAHLHPQLQDLLMQFLESSGHAGSQVVVTTHSPNLASGAKVERLTVLSRTAAAGNDLVGRCLGNFELEQRNLEHLRRFLDVTKSALLFSRGVILVEGVAEQLLVPVFAERMGRSLTTAGITVVNVDGLAFRPFIDLFGPEKLPLKCAVISDADPKAADVVDDDTPEQPQTQYSDAVQDAFPAQKCDGTTNGSNSTESPGSENGHLSATAQILKSLESPQVKIFLATKTLEWDLVSDDNWEILLNALKPIKPRVAEWLRRDYASSSTKDRADVLLTKVANVKGRFAQELTLLLAKAEHTDIPPHIRAAIEWATAAETSLPPTALATTPVTAN
ncbi:hypothetical protein C5F51_26540 [Nocardia nova]|uniref:Uncharacterized protein n=1 Tax=Nocardia nova TaxID=37330 RepID=A0A2S6A051_9NOCA|nr:hypothetical protein C5E46_35265 [Nocardia nova]PPJ24335.1 hypothetical protein C5F51_26540 [Nocardia nova]